jgi:hypothetical protein
VGCQEISSKLSQRVIHDSLKNNINDEGDVRKSWQTQAQRTVIKGNKYKTNETWKIT